jgi:PAS domain-containing protein
MQRDKKALEDRVENQTEELVRTNEALRAEIADLKHELKRLQESKERNRTLVENVDFGINLIDADHNIVMVNAAGSK